MREREREREIEIERESKRERSGCSKDSFETLMIDDVGRPTISLSHLQVSLLQIQISIVELVKKKQYICA